MAPIPAERIIGFADLPLPGKPEEEIPPASKSPEPRSAATLVTLPVEGGLRP